MYRILLLRCSTKQRLKRMRLLGSANNTLSYDRCELIATVEVDKRGRGLIILKLDIAQAPDFSLRYTTIHNFKLRPKPYSNRSSISNRKSLTRADRLHDAQIEALKRRCIWHTCATGSKRKKNGWNTSRALRSFFLAIFTTVLIVTRIRQRGHPKLYRRQRGKRREGRFT